MTIINGKIAIGRLSIREISMSLQIMLKFIKIQSISIYFYLKFN